MGFFFESRDKSACPLQRRVEIIDAKKQQESVAGRRVIGTRQGWMFVGAPPVEAEQYRSVRVEELPKVLVGGRCLRLAEQRLIPFEAGRYIAYADDSPQAFHGRLTLE